MVKIIILGTSQDGGNPHFMCECPNCVQSQIKHIERYVSCIGIIGDSKAFIIDATPDLPKQYNLFSKFLKTSNLQLTGIFLTHLHIGHYTGLIYFGKESISAKNFPLFSTKENLHFLQSNKPFFYLFERNEVQGFTIEPGIKLMLDKSLSILPFEVPHRNEDGNTLGFQIISKNSKKALYIPDIDYLTPEVDKLVSESNLIFLDATFYKQTELMRQKQIPHPPMVETIQRYGLQDKGKFYFIHVNHSNPVLDSESEEYNNVVKNNYEIASQGMFFEL